MTEPLAPPPRKDPQAATPVATVPPRERSRAALALGVAAAEGRFALQTCRACGAVLYPPRDACVACLSVDLVWRTVPDRGRLLAATTVRATPDPYFRGRLPWRTGLVQMEAGPVAVVHLVGAVARGDAVRLRLMTDRGGQGAMVAMAEGADATADDDPAMRALACHPKHRRVLITDGRAAVAGPLVAALRAAGAAHVFVGLAEAWRGWAEREAVASGEAVSVVPLDATDEGSVRRLAGEIGGKVDILVETGGYLRPGSVLAANPIHAGEAMAVNALALMRLARAFGPTMAARTADGVADACAVVVPMAAMALAPDPDFGAYAASQAARRSVALSLRAEFAPQGLRVVEVYHGPPEDAWHAAVPPPKLSPGALARTIVAGLIDGRLRIWADEVAKDMGARWAADPALFERDMGQP